MEARYSVVFAGLVHLAWLYYAILSGEHNVFEYRRPLIWAPCVLGSACFVTGVGLFAAVFHGGTLPIKLLLLFQLLLLSHISEVGQS